jgi:hypothetical protein
VRACASAADCGGVACVAGLASGPNAPARICDDPLPRARGELCAIAAPDSVQIYAECDPGGARFAVEEDLRWQWYATGGSFDTDGGAFDLGNATGSDVTFTPPDGALTVWLILRDGRGGEDWIRRDFR